MVLSSPLSGFICSPTGQTPDLPLPLRSEALWCVVLFLSSSDSSLSLLYHPTHPYLLSPHFLFRFNPPIRRDSESSYSFYFYLPPMFIIGYGPCARPALIMYVYNVCGLLLAFPRLEINLDLSTACLLYSNLRVVLVDYSITRSRSLVPACVRGT